MLSDEAIAEARDRQWVVQAACSKPSNAVWFPGQHQAKNGQVTEAKRICNEECPVREQCLVFALLNDARDAGGIYGGLSSKERARLRNRMRSDGTMVEYRVCVECHKPFKADTMYVKRASRCSDKCKLARARRSDAKRKRSGWRSLVKRRVNQGLPLTDAQKRVAEDMGLTLRP